MGDLVFALPAVKALRDSFPDATIDWIVEDKHAGLLRSCPFINNLVIFPRSSLRPLTLLKHLSQLRRRPQYDYIFDFQSNLKSALQLIALKSKHKVGFARPTAKEGSSLFHNQHVQVAPRLHRAQRDFEFLRRAFPSLQQPSAVRWPLKVEVDGADLTLLHTTTSNHGRDKDWGKENWIELAKRLKTYGHKVALLHTPGDRDHVQKIAIASGVNLAPETPSLEHLMALCDTARLLVSTDSGPAHITALRGQKVVCLYGPTDPLIYAPPGSAGVKVIDGCSESDVRPPRERSKQSPLMKKISVDAVVDAVTKLQL
jgi:ADP-heptose:LPS heptosyltransferase